MLQLNRCRHAALGVLAACAATIMFASSADADWLYSVDTDCGHLVSINTEDGDVVVVTELESLLDIPVPIRGMAFYEGMLHTIGRDAQQIVYRVYNPQTGELVHSAGVTLDGTAVSHADAITVDKQTRQLLIGFRGDDAQGATTSNTLGYLNPDGTISNPESLGSHFDMDDACIDDLTGVNIIIDRRPDEDISSIYEVSINPADKHWLADLFNGDYHDFDIASSGGQFFGLDRSGDAIHTINAENFLNSDDESLSRTGTYRTITPSDTEFPCSADLDRNGQVEVSDLLDLLADWGPTPCATSDLDGNGTTDTDDLLALIARWGDC